MSSPAHRASDADREAVADRLRAAAAEGRLDPDELEERVAAAYSAKTVSDLVPLTTDLPAAPSPPSPGPRLWDSMALRSRLATFLTVNLVCIAIWLATGAESSFWPGWVLLFTGLMLGRTLIRTTLGVDDESASDPESRASEGRLPERSATPRRRDARAARRSRRG